MNNYSCTPPTTLIGQYMNYKQFVYEYALTIYDSHDDPNEQITSALAFVDNHTNDTYLQALYVHAYHESDKFKSGLYVNHKNMFGMGAPNSRKLYCDVIQMRDNLTGVTQSFAAYSFAGLSIKDRIGWDYQKNDFVTLMYNASDTDVMNYFLFLKEHGYASDPSFSTKLYSLYMQMKNANLFSVGIVSPHANRLDGVTYTEDELNNMEHGQGIFGYITDFFDTVGTVGKLIKYALYGVLIYYGYLFYKKLK